MVHFAKVLVEILKLVTFTWKIFNNREVCYTIALY